MGFNEERWNNILRRGHGIVRQCSHEIRALITIVGDERPRPLDEVYQIMRENDNLSK